MQLCSESVYACWVAESKQLRPSAAAIINHTYTVAPSLWLNRLNRPPWSVSEAAHDTQHLGELTSKTLADSMVLLPPFRATTLCLDVLLLHVHDTKASAVSLQQCHPLQERL